MFKSQISSGTDLVRAAMLLGSAAAVAAVVAGQLAGAGLLAAEPPVQPSAFALVAQTATMIPGETDLSILRDILAREELARFSDAELHNMLGDTLGFFTTLTEPARPAAEIEAELATATGTGVIEPVQRFELANELNAALAFEAVQQRVETVLTEIAARKQAN